MSNDTKSLQPLVLAAVKLGTVDHPSLRVASQLCRRTGMRLRLVTAIELDTAAAGRYGPNDMFDFTAIGRSEGDGQRAQAEDTLQSMAAKLELDSKVEISAIVGAPTQAILSDAVVSGASFIVTGAAKGSHHFVPKGLSTALTLIAESPIPVLVVNESCALDLTRKNLKILVGDDLSESCERSVLASFDLAIGLGRTDVHHVHANALSIETFAANVQKLRAMRGNDPAADIGPTELWEEVQRDLHQRIRSRTRDRTSRLEATGGHYWPEIRNGRVELEIEKAIETAAPDIIAFGRHVPVHRRPFTIGRVPFHFMLSQDRAILVVPP